MPHQSSGYYKHLDAHGDVGADLKEVVPTGVLDRVLDGRPPLLPVVGDTTECPGSLSREDFCGGEDSLNGRQLDLRGFEMLIDVLREQRSQMNSDLLNVRDSLERRMNKLSEELKLMLGLPKTPRPFAYTLDAAGQGTSGTPLARRERRLPTLERRERRLPTLELPRRPQSPRRQVGVSTKQPPTPRSDQAASTPVNSPRVDDKEGGDDEDPRKRVLEDLPAPATSVLDTVEVTMPPQEPEPPGSGSLPPALSPRSGGRQSAPRSPKSPKTVASFKRNLSGIMGNVKESPRQNELAKLCPRCVRRLCCRHGEHSEDDDDDGDHSHIVHSVKTGGSHRHSMSQDFQAVASQLEDNVDSLFRKHVSSTKVDTAVGALIMGNAIVMMVQLQYEGYISAISLDLRQADGSWQDAENIFDITEHIFNGFFLAELAGRLLVYRRRFFKDFSNLYDMFLVVSTSVQMYILQPLNVGAGTNLTLFRLTRFVKFVRVLRIVRVMKLFGELRILVSTIVSSFRALLWSMVLLMMIMLMSAVFLCQLLKDFVQNDKNPWELRYWTYRHYGSSSRAVWTMFEVTLSGGWPNYARKLVEEVSGWYSVFWLVYIWCVVFAVIRIITAIFLKETLQCAANDAEMMVNEQMKAKSRYIEKLKNVFNAVDVSGDGRLSKKEFGCIMGHPKVKSWLQILELEVHDADGLFQLLDDGDGEITYDEFLKGVVRLKGHARSVDVVAILRSSDKMVRGLTELRDVLASSGTESHHERFSQLLRVCSSLEEKHDRLHEHLTTQLADSVMDYEAENDAASHYDAMVGGARQVSH